MQYCDFFPSYDIDECTGEVTVKIPRSAWNPAIQRSEAFKNRR